MDPGWGWDGSSLVLSPTPSPSPPGDHRLPGRQVHRSAEIRGGLHRGGLVRVGGDREGGFSTHLGDRVGTEHPTPKPCGHMAPPPPHAPRPGETSGRRRRVLSTLFLPGGAVWWVREHPFVPVPHPFVPVPPPQQTGHRAAAEADRQPQHAAEGRERQRGEEGHPHHDPALQGGLAGEAPLGAAERAGRWAPMGAGGEEPRGFPPRFLPSCSGW